ncbi:MAG: hypothetical protein KAH84_06170 [Thiomargarita sp.]|nr:hypothetical protein [Thiomargarita sp.]
MSYSKDLRKRAIDFVIEGKNSMRSTSKIFGIQYNTMKEWVKIFKETGKFTPKPICGKQPTKINLSELHQQVLEHPDRFQYEHVQTFGVTQSAISKALKKLEITLKKNHLLTKNKIKSKQKNLNN